MPKNERNSSLKEIQSHEFAIRANARLGGYGMYEHCPITEIVCMHATLSEFDVKRLFVLPEFRKHTRDHSCRLVDMNESALAIAMERQPAGTQNELDLTTRSRLELVLVGTDMKEGPLIAVDGNHRLIAHYIRHGSIEGVPVYIGIHPNMYNWSFVPPLAH